MRDLHIEALVRQYGGEEGKELAECPVVREYRCHSLSIKSWICTLDMIPCIPFDADCIPLAPFSLILYTVL